MLSTYDVLVVGAGIFGLTAALELKARGHSVAIVDPGPLPHPLAASTDISKVVRAEYGTDTEYVELADKARQKWLRWNEGFGDELYHEVGIVMLTRTPMASGGFEYESYQVFRERGHTVERLDRDDIAEQFPMWNAGMYVDGYFHAEAGYVESGRVIKTLITQARDAGIALYAGQTVNDIRSESGRVSGVSTREGTTFDAGHVVIAAGAWTQYLVPDLQPDIHAVGQPVFHVRPTNTITSRFEPPAFPVFGADVTKTGWYGFPLHPREGVIKIANHGPGTKLHPSDDERIVTEAQKQKLRTFLAESLPALADAPITYTRCCLYCDTLDEHFWIAQHPEQKGLTVAAGGSGHAFKFGPVLGELTADAVEGTDNPYLHKFRWRHLSPDTVGEEGTRYHGD